MNKKSYRKCWQTSGRRCRSRGFLTRAFDWEENLNYCLVGIRRAGKSYLLIQRIHELLKEGVPEDHILYVNFEDERLPGDDGGGARSMRRGTARCVRIAVARCRMSWG